RLRSISRSASRAQRTRLGAPRASPKRRRAECQGDQAHALGVAKESVEPQRDRHRQARRRATNERVALPRIPAEGDARGDSRSSAGARRSRQASRLDRLGESLEARAVPPGRKDNQAAHRRRPRLRANRPLERAGGGDDRHGADHHEALLRIPFRLLANRADHAVLLRPRARTGVPWSRASTKTLGEGTKSSWPLPIRSRGRDPTVARYYGLLGNCPRRLRHCPVGATKSTTELAGLGAAAERRKRR